MVQQLKMRNSINQEQVSKPSNLNLFGLYEKRQAASLRLAKAKHAKEMKGTLRQLDKDLIDSSNTMSNADSTNAELGQAEINAQNIIKDYKYKAGKDKELAGEIGLRTDRLRERDINGRIKSVDNAFLEQEVQKDATIKINKLTSQLTQPLTGAERKAIEDKIKDIRNGLSAPEGQRAISLRKVYLNSNEISAKALLRQNAVSSSLASLDKDLVDGLKVSGLDIDNWSDAAANKGMLMVKAGMMTLPNLKIWMKKSQTKLYMAKSLRSAKSIKDKFVTDADHTKTENVDKHVKSYIAALKEEKKNAQNLSIDDVSKAILIDSLNKTIANAGPDVDQSIVRSTERNVNALNDLANRWTVANQNGDYILAKELQVEFNENHTNASNLYKSKLNQKWGIEETKPLYEGIFIQTPTEPTKPSDILDPTNLPDLSTINQGTKEYDVSNKKLAQNVAYYIQQNKQVPPELRAEQKRRADIEIPKTLELFQDVKRLMQGGAASQEDVATELHNVKGLLHSLNQSGLDTSEYRYAIQAAQSFVYRKYNDVHRSILKSATRILLASSYSLTDKQALFLRKIDVNELDKNNQILLNATLNHLANKDDKDYKTVNAVMNNLYKILPGNFRSNDAIEKLRVEAEESADFDLEDAADNVNTKEVNDYGDLIAANTQKKSIVAEAIKFYASSQAAVNDKFIFDEEHVTQWLLSDEGRMTVQISLLSLQDVEETLLDETYDVLFGENTKDGYGDNSSPSAIGIRINRGY